MPTYAHTQIAERSPPRIQIRSGAGISADAADQIYRWDLVLAARRGPNISVSRLVRVGLPLIGGRAATTAGSAIRHAAESAREAALCQARQTRAGTHLPAAHEIQREIDSATVARVDSLAQIAPGLGCRMRGAIRREVCHRAIEAALSLPGWVCLAWRRRAEATQRVRHLWPRALLREEADRHGLAPSDRAIRDRRSRALDELHDRIRDGAATKKQIHAHYMETIREYVDDEVADGPAWGWPLADVPLVSECLRDHGIQPEALLCALISGFSLDTPAEP